MDEMAKDHAVAPRGGLTVDLGLAGKEPRPVPGLLPVPSLLGPREDRGHRSPEDRVTEVGAQGQRMVWKDGESCQHLRPPWSETHTRGWGERDASSPEGPPLNPAGPV